MIVLIKVEKIVQPVEEPDDARNTIKNGETDSHYYYFLAESASQRKLKGKNKSWKWAIIIFLDKKKKIYKERPREML